MERLKYILGSLFILLFNTLAWADVDQDVDDDPLFQPGYQGGLEGTNIPRGLGHGLGTRSTSIDMYEGILIGVAVLLIVGYIYYNYTQRSKKLLS